MATAPVYPFSLARGITEEGDISGFELFAGEADIVTSQYTAGEAITQFDVLVISPAGIATIWNGTDFPGGAEATMVPVPTAIAAQSIANATMGPVYVAGAFNHAALRWPGGADTLAKRKAAFAGTSIVINRLLGGLATRMTYP